MNELQILNKILSTKSLSIIQENNISPNFFITYNNEYKFILEHYNKYGVVPDTLTVLSKFDDFDIIEVTETDKYLIDKLREQFLYSQLVPVVTKIAELVTTDSVQAVNYMKKEMENLVSLQSTFIEGMDIVKQASTRLEEYKQRKLQEGMLGISSGFKDMDYYTHGFIGGDLATITARPNEGKSWIVVYFLLNAWKEGKRVLLYSGEMEENMVGYRFDTMLEHFSNMGLINGDTKLGDNMTGNDYEKFIESLSNNPVPFIVVTPKMLGNKPLDCATLDNLIVKYKPDIIGIDQLSLMADYRQQKGDNERIRFSNISWDLFLLANKYNIPVLLDNQAKRKDRKKGEESDTPELDDAYGADAVVQNATKVFTLMQTSAGLKISIKKNRYGMRNLDFLYFWDINSGYFKLLSKPEILPQKTTNYENTNSNTEVKDTNEFDNGVDLF